MFPTITINALFDELQKVAAQSGEAPQPSEDELRRHRELWKRLAEAAQIPIEIDPSVHDAEYGYYDSKDNKIVVRSDSDYQTLAHELGHADLHQSVLGRLMQHPINRWLFPRTDVASAIAGALLAVGKKKGLLLPLLTAGPTLLSEHLATRKGRQELEMAQATPEEIEQYKGELNAGTKTYYNFVIPPSLASGAMGYIALR